MAYLDSNFVDVDDLIKEHMESLLDRLECFGDVASGGVDIHPIENERVSGFIPYTNGGHEICIPATLAFAYGSGSEPKCIRPYLKSCLSDCEETFKEMNNLHREEQPYDSDHPMHEDYCDFENDYLSEGGTYFYKVRAIYYVEPEPHVVFWSALNTDFEYGRDGDGNNKHEMSITKTVDELFYNPELLPVITEQLYRNLCEA